MGSLFRRAQSTKGPTRLLLPIQLDEIPGVWSDFAGIPRPHWDIVQNWIEQQQSQHDLAQVYWKLTFDWLQALQRSLGTPFQCWETENFRMLAPFSPTRARYQLQFLELSRAKVLSWLGDLCWTEDLGPHVVVVLKGPQQYWEYFSYFGIDGEQGGSIGCNIRQGYPHIALFDSEVSHMQTTLAHELVHGFLCHRGMPLWLEEGLCGIFPSMVGCEGSSLATLSDEIGRIRQVLREPGVLADFWSGEAFASPREDLQRAAYHLAEVLIRLILDQTRGPQFHRFLQDAQFEDSGESSALNHLKRSLGDWAATFLGPGEWAPELASAVEEEGYRHEHERHPGHHHGIELHVELA